MKLLSLALLCLFCLTTGTASAWSNHSSASYRAFEKMPEVVNARPVNAEPLEVFLKAQEQAIADLLNRQETWARSQLPVYPKRPDALSFKADPARSDAARRLAFLQALRVAPDSRLALYLQVDPRNPPPAPASLLPHSTVDTLAEQANASNKYIRLQAGDTVPALAVLASATDEPDFGMDINLWEDSPSDWGKTYGLGPLPFGNPALYFATQAPFHMGFYHEDRLLYLAAPFIKKTFPLLRAHQYSSLAVLAFRTGHPYWGWRFSGLALHYVQDLTQPYHASLSPGDSSLKLIGINLLAMLGFPKMKNEKIVLLSNRHLALERYQNQQISRAALSNQDSDVEKALRNDSQDASHPAWSDVYARDVVSRQSQVLGSKISDILLDTLPPKYVLDPTFDFGARESGIDLVGELMHQNQAKRARLDKAIAELMGNFGTHSRNVLRGILKAMTRPQ